MSLCKLLICQLSLCWLFLSAVVQAEPLLSGIAVHKELGQEQFLGSLYADVLSHDADVILDEHVAKRMELKILARDGIAPRRFTRMWIEGAAINIPTATMSAQVESMLAFDKFFRGRLEQNDHLVFEFIPNKGVDVSLNSALLGSIDSPEFFAVLLRSWIGRVPLSSHYRDELLRLGEFDQILFQRYKNIQPHPNRTAIAQTWRDARDESSQAEVAAVAVVSDAKERDISTATTQQIPAPVRPPVTVPALPVESLIGKAPASQSEPTGEPELAIVTASSVNDAEISTSQSQAKVREVDDAPSQLTAQMLVAQQFYISDVMNRIYAEVIYPRRARELQQSGSVKMRVVIDADGNIITLQPMEMSSYSMLNKAVESAIKNSAPFPSLPSSVAAQGLEFSVPVIFSLGQS